MRRTPPRPPRETATPSPDVVGQPVGVIAGTGASGDSGDGGPARQATFEYPTGLVLDHDAIYVADDEANKVRRISPDGTVTTVAGDGSDDSHGDGGPALDAGINSPDDVVVAPDGT